MMNKIHLFLTKEDYKKKLTEDNIINVTGSVGSGKSTYGLKYRDNNDYIVISTDSLYSDNDPATLTKEVIELRNLLIKKYGNITEANFTLYYPDIIKYIKTKKKIGIIEGGSIADIDNIKVLRGTVIVKRAARIKCYYRAVLRDYKNPVWRVGLNRIGLIKRFFHCARRRLKQLKHQEYIEEFIKELQNI